MNDILNRLALHMNEEVKTNVVLDKKTYLAYKAGYVPMVLNKVVKGKYYITIMEL